MEIDEVLIFTIIKKYLNACKTFATNFNLTQNRAVCDMIIYPMDHVLHCPK